MDDEDDDEDEDDVPIRGPVPRSSPRPGVKGWAKPRLSASPPPDDPEVQVEPRLSAAS